MVLMKYFLTIFLALISFHLFSQSYAEDFESFDEGEDIADQSNYWSTAFGGRGGGGDVEVDDGDALSGSQSLRLRGPGIGRRPAVYLSFGGGKRIGNIDNEFLVEN